MTWNPLRSLFLQALFLCLIGACDIDTEPVSPPVSASGSGAMANTAAAGGSRGADESAAGSSPGGGGQQLTSPRAGSGGNEQGADADASPRWVGSWASGQQLTEPNNNPPAPGLADNTLRQNVFPTLSGDRVRVRFSNEYGSSAVVIQAATIATHSAGANVTESSPTALRFDGSAGTSIPVGSAVYSDPVAFRIEALQSVTVTTAFGNVEGGITGHPGSRTTSFIATGGDAVDDAAFPTAAQTDHWYIVSNIDVERTDDARAIVVLGDSITDGRGSVTNGNTRWPDFLARRLNAQVSTRNVSVLNLGIGGNAVLQGGLGPTARARFDSQVLAQPGVRWVVVLEGVNDLGGIGERSAQDMANAITGAYEEFIDKSHAAGLTIYGATITPFAGSGYGSNPSALEARNLINQWIRESGRFDGVIDFTDAVSAPGNPEQLREDLIYQNDYLHLNPAGLEAMGNAVDLGLFSTEE